MSWCNVLQRAGSDYCLNDNFPGIFADFCLKIFTDEKKIVHMVMHVQKIFNCNVSLQTALSKFLLIVSKELWK